jgi:hypothetical protein
MTRLSTLFFLFSAPANSPAAARVIEGCDADVGNADASGVLSEGECHDSAFGTYDEDESGDWNQEEFASYQREG